MDKPVMAGVIEILATLPTSPLSTSCRIHKKQTTHFKKCPCFKNNEETEVRIKRLKSMGLD